MNRAEKKGALPQLHPHTSPEGAGVFLHAQLLRARTIKSFIKLLAVKIPVPPYVRPESDWLIN